MINLDEYELIESLDSFACVNAENITYFDSFGVEHISKEIRKFIVTKIYRMQAYNSMICGYF